MSTTISAQDVMAVRSRISWSSVIAGAVTALAMYVLLSSLGVAIGISVIQQVNDRDLGIGASIWAIASTLLALFIGGCVTTRLAVGETKGEALIHGIVLWGVVFAMLLWLMVGGVQLGFNAVMGVANSPITGMVSSRISEQDLRAAGLTDTQISEWRTRVQARTQNLSNEIRSELSDSRTTSAAWWTFGGIFLSMLASVGGALAGSGPTLRLRGLRWQAAVSRPTTGTTAVAR